MLTACYDLAWSPPTYDAVAFILHAEAVRVKLNEAHLKIIILPGPNGGFRQDSLWPRSIDVRAAMLRDVVIPMCELLPSCVSVEQFARNNRGVTSKPVIGVGQSLYGLSRMVTAIAAIGRPLRAKLKPRNSKLVTITLRECEHWPARNSNVKEWLAAASTIQNLGFHVTFVRDSYQAGSRFNLFPIHATASSDLHARASLYSSAFCNLFVSNGPAWLAIALDAPVLMLKPTTESLGGCYGGGYLASCGLSPNTQLPNSPIYQRIVWQDDNAANIVVAFESFVKAVS